MNRSRIDKGGVGGVGIGRGVRRGGVPLAAGAAALALLAGAQPSSARPVAWGAAWAASPQLPSTGFTPNWSQEGFSHQSVRQVVRVTEGGDRLRIRLSNAYGTSPLALTGATVAKAGQRADVQPGSVRELTFGGRKSVSVPAHGELRSDAARLGLERLDSVTVTLYFAGTTGPATFHAQGFADTYRAEGDHRADPSGRAFTATSRSWYYLSGVEVGGGARRDGVALFGDSITDGFGSTTGANRRYSDALAERTGRPVLNAGIGGNLVLNDSAWYGERSAARFGRDVLDQPGVSTVVVLEGVNDIGFSEAQKGPKPQPTYKPAPVVSSAQLIDGYRELIRQAHSRGLKAVGATLLPLKGSDHWGEHSARVSDEVNEWIRTSGAFDAVADFDKALASKADPDRLAPAYDSGDTLHPNDAGYRAMAEVLAKLL
ncbi:SGNH/GDSL hydrolase family protein [Streptomyces violascens]|uniref:SGNH hydrolase n=1 Tax=Streptomyces violascens TaxID=67381 RepID=A0ABQ3QLS3_9ACTN|nr:SGNH/GDSL hydrolase family protein [Streptomyces violascens]GGU09700.1 SGNH hydrolase [Streptomyces violascens]GHI38224.1 SGNH hydrolase [Streptomyces violascens]